jgi:hypothetical protein
MASAATYFVCDGSADSAPRFTMAFVVDVRGLELYVVEIVVAIFVTQSERSRQKV